MYFVLREPQGLEDEGRHCFCGSFKTKEEAEEFIKNQEYASRGKYTFTIARPERTF